MTAVCSQNQRVALFWLFVGTLGGGDSYHYVEEMGADPMDGQWYIPELGNREKQGEEGSSE